MEHLYLFTLEVVPLSIGKTYPTLPSHLTLMSRFRSSLSSDALEVSVQPLFRQTKPIGLVFGKEIELGPKKLRVHTIDNSPAIKTLHGSLYSLLAANDVTFEYPAFIGPGHKPHVTKREGVQFDVGYQQPSAAAYLIEVVDGRRIIRARCRLDG